jgi:hypothetical protein
MKKKKKPRKLSQYQVKYGMRLIDMAKRYGGNYSTYAKLEYAGQLVAEIKRLEKLKKGKE